MIVTYSRVLGPERRIWGCRICDNAPHSLRLVRSPSPIAVYRQSEEFYIPTDQPIPRKNPADDP